jgi:hypothetical protein
MNPALKRIISEKKYKDGNHAYKMQKKKKENQKEKTKTKKEY